MRTYVESTLPLLANDNRQGMGEATKRDQKLKVIGLYWDHPILRDIKPHKRRSRSNLCRYVFVSYESESAAKSTPFPQRKLVSCTRNVCGQKSTTFVLGYLSMDFGQMFDRVHGPLECLQYNAYERLTKIC